MNWAGKKWKDLLLGPMTIHGGVLLGSLGLPFFVTPVDLWLSRALLPFKGSPWESFFELTNYLGHGLFLGSLCTALILWGVWRKNRSRFGAASTDLLLFSPAVCWSKFSNISSEESAPGRWGPGTSSVPIWAGAFLPSRPVTA